jgi:hypothetical protein
MPNDLEAKARIKINKLHEEAGWRFFETNDGKVNIHLESQAVCAIYPNERVIPEYLNISFRKVCLYEI